MQKKQKGIIILSGGLDSTVLAHDLIKNKNFDLIALSFNYGQKHSKELECAKLQCEILKIPHKIIDLSFMNTCFKSSLLNSGEDIPEGHYEDENMKSTVVPNRNMILLSIAAGIAISEKRNFLFYGAHGGDHAIYPDCRKEFVKSMQESLKLCDWEKISLEVPYLDLDKTEIVKKGLGLKIDFSKTWTCYKGLKKPCGKCGSCVERLEAFEKNNSEDFLKY